MTRLWSPASTSNSDPPLNYIFLRIKILIRGSADSMKKKEVQQYNKNNLLENEKHEYRWFYPKVDHPTMNSL